MHRGFRFAAFLGFALLFAARPAFAYQFGGQSHKPRRQLMLGMTRFAHYSGIESEYTIPPTVFIETQLILEPISRIQLGGLAGFAVTNRPGYEFGGLLALVVVDIEGGESMFRRLRMIAQAQGVYFKVPPPVAPNLWQDSGIQYRYGGRTDLFFESSERAALSTAAMLSRYSMVWNLVITAGFAFRF